MFKVKFLAEQKASVLKQRHIEEQSDYQIVLCEKADDIEADKINLCFAYEHLDQVTKLMAFKNTPLSIKVPCTTERGEEMVALHMIDFIESFGNEISASVNQRVLRISSKLYKLEDEWRKYGFVRISKSQIVNVGKIAAIKRGFNGKLLLVLENNQHLEVNRSFVKDFKAYMEGRKPL